jgi:hypothetical protein
MNLFNGTLWKKEINVRDFIQQILGMKAFYLRQQRELKIFGIKLAN